MAKKAHTMTIGKEAATAAVVAIIVEKETGEGERGKERRKKEGKSFCRLTDFKYSEWQKQHKENTQQRERLDKGWKLLDFCCIMKN